MSLVELNYNGIFLTDKGSIHSYLKFYDELFRMYRDYQINIFEVGYQYGGSCELWKQYFLHASIRSIDIRKWEPTTDRINLNLQNEYIEPEGRVTLEYVDIKELTGEYFKDFKPHIAIDDGSHLLEDQLHFVKTVYPVLAKGGMLIVEDLQDWDNQLMEFNKLGYKFHVVDQREVSGMYDDVFIWFTNPQIYTDNDSVNHANRFKSCAVQPM
jgi:hypothetical protein